MSINVCMNGKNCIMKKTNVFVPENYVTYQNGRVFIDICNSGCGSACKYCYSPTCFDAQHLLSIEEIKLICEYILENYLHKIEVVSLCPNTEPLKSNKSIQLVLYIVDFFTNLDCKIQISTKEIIPLYFLDKLNSISKNNIFLNISIPLLEESSIIEPFAASIEERFKNFKKIKLFNHLSSCLYIKPFFNKKKEFPQYINLINELRIDNVCVGVKFTNSTNNPCVSLYDNVVAKDLFENQIEAILDFITEIRELTKAKVFGSSICCIKKNYKEKCDIKLYRYNELLCTDCDSERSSL